MSNSPAQDTMKEEEEEEEGTEEDGKSPKLLQTSQTRKQNQQRISSVIDVARLDMSRWDAEFVQIT